MSDNTNLNNNTENVLSINDIPIGTYNAIDDPEENNAIDDSEENNTIDDPEETHHKSIKQIHISNDDEQDDDELSLDSITYSSNSIISTPRGTFDWFSTKEYIIFKNQLSSLRKNNNFILKEGKECKRLLDLKYEDLTSMVNNIQTSVIFMSTISGFFQATKTQFGINLDIIAVFSITISTYISLILSISKYYKLDELKDRIQTLREKYSLLHNRIDYRMDVLGPWNNKNLWEHQNPKVKLDEWKEILERMNTDYNEIIKTKQDLTTDFEIIMDTISRNKYNTINSFINYNDREKLFLLRQKENQLEKRILEASQNYPSRKRPSILLQHEELDNWADDDSVV